MRVAFSCSLRAGHIANLKAICDGRKAAQSTPYRELQLAFDGEQMHWYAYRGGRHMIRLSMPLPTPAPMDVTIVNGTEFLSALKPDVDFRFHINEAAGTLTQPDSVTSHIVDLADRYETSFHQLWTKLNGAQDGGKWKAWTTVAMESTDLKLFGSLKDDAGKPTTVLWSWTCRPHITTFELDGSTMSGLTTINTIHTKLEEVSEHYTTD